MLKETVDQLRGEAHEEAPPCRVETPYSCYLPDRYVPDADERMLLYKRIARMVHPDEAVALGEELRDRFGDPPPPARTLVDLAHIKLEASQLGVAMVQLRDPGYRLLAREGARRTAETAQHLPRGEASLEFAPGRALSPEAAARLSETFGRRILFKAGKTFAVSLIGQPPTPLVDEVKNLLQVARFASKINSLPKR
jgi:transcription-repair coupling factor (superfamily II helicase)